MPCAGLEVKASHITICMGSSCFARGNVRNLEVIQALIRQRGLKERLKVAGVLCQGLCNRGPNMMLDGKQYHELDPVAVLDLLDFHLQSRHGG